MCECRELQQQSKVRDVSILGVGGWARRGVGREDTLSVQLSICVYQLVVLHVN